MIAYSMLGTNNLNDAYEFYNELLAQLDAACSRNTERVKIWKFKTGALFGICNPADGQPASVGNGTMIAFPVETKTQADKLLEKALVLGAKECNPTTELLDENNNVQFYGRYVRDLDGNKLCFCMGSL